MKDFKAEYEAFKEKESDHRNFSSFLEKAYTLAWRESEEQNGSIYVFEEHVKQIRKFCKESLKYGFNTETIWILPSSVRIGNYSIERNLPKKIKKKSLTRKDILLRK